MWNNQANIFFEDINIKKRNKYMEETFKGEAAIIEKLKAAAKKAHDKYSKALKELQSINQRLDGFNLAIEIESGEIVKLQDRNHLVPSTHITKI